MYNVIRTLTVTLTSRKPCQHNNKFECSVTFSTKRHRKEMIKAIFNVVLLFNRKKKHKLFFCSLYGTFKLVPSCRLAPWHSVKRADFCPFYLLMTCPYNSQCRGENQSKQDGAFWYIILRVMLLTYIRAMIRFSNCGGLSRMQYWCL